MYLHRVSYFVISLSNTRQQGFTLYFGPLKNAAQILTQVCLSKKLKTEQSELSSQLDKCDKNELLITKKNMLYV